VILSALGILMQIVDYLYVKSTSDYDALIVLLSAIKRSQILIAVLLGGIFFKKKNKPKKLIPYWVFYSMYY
jgi:hypothetical protein